MPHQEHERERDQTHSYWYIPSAPRVNYSLLIMESVGMMKMVTSDGSPLRQGAGTGSQLVFGGYRGLRRWNSRSRFVFGGLCIYRNFWHRSHVRGSPSHPRGRGHAQGGRARPPPSWMAGDSSGPTLLLWGFFWSIKNHQKLARELESVWYSFSVKIKNKEKIETGTGL